MSKQAILHVKEIDNVTARQKYLLMILAGLYNDELQCAFPAVPTIAARTGIREPLVCELLGQLRTKGHIDFDLYKKPPAYVFPRMPGGVTADIARARVSEL